MDACLVCRLCTGRESRDRAGRVPGKGTRWHGCGRCCTRDICGIRGRTQCWGRRSRKGSTEVKRLLPQIGLLLLLSTAGGAALGDHDAAKASHTGFPQTVRVRLWYLHPPRELRIRADAGRAQMRSCATCKTTAIAAAAVHATESRIGVEGDKSSFSEIRVTGAYQMNATGDPPLRDDFPIEMRASDGHLLISAFMPMEEYIAGVLAGETGNFKSDEALKAMAVAARTYAMHFGSRHALEGFDFCDT